MRKIITCPECGKILCRANTGSEVELLCHACKVEIKGMVDKEGGVHIASLSTKDAQRKQAHAV